MSEKRLIDPARIAGEILYEARGVVQIVNYVAAVMVDGVMRRAAGVKTDFAGRTAIGQEDRAWARSHADAVRRYPEGIARDRQVLAAMGNDW